MKSLCDRVFRPAGIFCAVLLLSLTLGAWGASASSGAAKVSSEKETRVVVDHTGKEVRIPAKIERIVITGPWPLPSVYCLFEGAGDKLVGIHPGSMSAAQHSLLPRVAPGVLKARTEFLKGDVLNAEELLELEPDVVFYRVETAAHAKQLALTGIPSVGFSTALSGFDTIKTFESWVKLLGEVLQQEDRAGGIVEYGRKTYDEIQAALNGAKDLRKPRALILFNYGDGIIKTSGSNFYGQYWLESTGAVNVASGLSGVAEINMEQIYAWDPDIIYITNFSRHMPEDLYENAIPGHDWSTVKAVREKKVYKFPLGMYRWYPPASDTPLVLKWLAQKNQPELFARVDMDAEVRSYYKRFYGVDLTDDELHRIFHPVREAANTK
ncbi:ABC transporter substrate-binding protein [Fretibacterium sp. OH1220_COT-178]|uniref:ABC transporter substrate-binding protein n=1 Tax=Fretibacterium sp. OH1220_COT-178 TaxID=2491047 RepID=UPI0018F40F96|nr:ABC transporter substrate-binding protein [Fretibacterium sp. OH1220_COT-178]